jgi:polysaccharide export outer membrane protein
MPASAPRQTNALALSSRGLALRGSSLRGLAGALLLFCASCAPGSGLAPLPSYSARTYQLGGGDQVRVIVYGEDQLTGEYRVDDQDKIALPLIGTLTVTGLSSEQLASKIAGDLKQRNIIRDPSVSVEVLAYRPIYVLGEVARPGEYPYQPGMTMLTAVAVAGGFTYRAVQGYASDVRTTNTHSPTEGSITPLTVVAPGDVIKVFERRF